MSRQVLSLIIAALTVSACAGDARPPGDAGAPGAQDSVTGAAGGVTPVASARWPVSGPVDIRRSRALDMTGDGAAEQVVITAAGERYDSLAIAVTVTAPAGDTLWREAWTSRYYFVYDGLEGKSDSAVRGIVQAHVDTLLADRHFSERGVPEPLRSGVGDFQRDAVRYSLAELDYRRERSLGPAEAFPVEGYSRIDVQTIDEARVDAVIRDIADRPAFMYFAGGEATYAIAWSARENAFVRIYSCC